MSSSRITRSPSPQVWDLVRLQSFLFDVDTWYIKDTPNLGVTRLDSPVHAGRFLRARKFHVEKALEMLREDLAWRKSEDVLTLAARELNDIVQCDVVLVHTNLPQLQCGFDKQVRRPDCWRRGSVRLAPPPLASSRWVM